MIDLLDLPHSILSSIVGLVAQTEKLALSECNHLLRALSMELLYENIYITDVDYVKSTHGSFVFPYERKFTIMTPIRFDFWTSRCLTLPQSSLVKRIVIHLTKPTDLDLLIGIMNLPNAVLTRFSVEKEKNTPNDRLDSPDLLACYNFRPDLLLKSLLHGTSSQRTISIPLIINNLEDCRSLAKHFDHRVVIRGNKPYQDNVRTALHIDKLLLNLSPGVIFENFTRLFSSTKIDFNNIREFSINNDNYECLKYFIQNNVKLSGLKKFKLHFRDAMSDEFTRNVIQVIPFEQLKSFSFRFRVSHDTLIPAIRKEDGLRGFLIKKKRLSVEYVEGVFFSKVTPRLTNLKELSFSMIGIDTGHFPEVLINVLTQVPSSLESLTINTHAASLDRYYTALGRHQQSLKRLSFVGLLDDHIFCPPSTDLLIRVHNYYGYYLFENHPDITALPDHLELVNQADERILFNEFDGRTSVGFFIDLFDKNGPVKSFKTSICLKEAARLSHKRSSLDYTDDDYLIPKLDRANTPLKTVRYVGLGIKGLLSVDSELASSNLYKNLEYVTINGLHYIIRDRNPILVSDYSSTSSY